jgi:hypothetical protein
MSELFPELDRELVRHILRDGVRVDQEDSISKEIVDFLCRLKIVTVCEHQYVRCAYRDDYDFLDRRDLNCKGRVEISDGSDDYYCPECGQPIGDIDRKKYFVEYEVSLNSEGIEAYLLEALLTLEPIETLEKIGRAAFGAKLRSEVSLKVVVPDYAGVQHLSAGLFFAEPTLYIIASPIDDPPKTILEESQYLGLSEILSEPVAAIEERISIAAIPIQGRRDLSDVEARFDDMLERHRNRRWQFFEQDFIPAFVQCVTERPELSEAYLSRLKRLHQTIFGTYHVPIGGSGVTDLRGIGKYELMTELFRGEFIGDAKCYVDSALEYEKLTSVITHLETDSTKPRKAVVFVAGDDISSTSWDLMIRLRDQWGYWRLAIVPKYLLLEMISELDAIRLLDM